MAPRNFRAIVFLLLSSSCAYGYAGKEAKKRSEREYKPTVKVTVREAEEDPDEKEPDEPPPEPKKPESPCGTPTFQIFYYTGSTQVVKTVDCKQRSVVDIAQTEIPSATYENQQSAGLPEASWYLLVDPKGQRADVLNNSQLLKLSREFSIEYYGRDTARDLLVYLYQQEDVQ